MSENNDIKAILFSKYPYLLKNFIARCWFTPILKIKCLCNGVFLGKKCHFYGKTFFYRAPNSQIIIGSNCGFRSTYNSNLIGIKQNCMFSTILPDAVLSIGDNCGFSGSVIGVFKSIILGNNIRCGANTLITDSDWHLDDPRSNEPKPILIENNVWLGEGVKVFKGVRIGVNSVIGAGSIVTKNIPANVIAAGNPCKVIKKLNNNNLLKN